MASSRPCLSPCVCKKAAQRDMFSPYFTCSRPAPQWGALGRRQAQTWRPRWTSLAKYLSPLLHRASHSPTWWADARPAWSPRAGPPSTPLAQAAFVPTVPVPGGYPDWRPCPAPEGCLSVGQSCQKSLSHGVKMHSLLHLQYSLLPLSPSCSLASTSLPFLVSNTRSLPPSLPPAFLKVPWGNFQVLGKLESLLSHLGASLWQGSFFLFGKGATEMRGLRQCGFFWGGAHFSQREKHATFWVTPSHLLRAAFAGPV